MRISERIKIKVIKPNKHYFADKFFDIWYLSNTFSFNNGDFFNDTIMCGNNQFVNLSLRNLITSKWNIDLFECKTPGVKYDLEINQYDFAIIKEFNYCIDFLLSYPENIDLNITIPTDICFYVNWYDKGYFLSEEENDDLVKKIRDKIKKEEADILNGLEKKNNSSKRNYKDFYKIILYSLFYNYCRAYLFLDKYDDLNRKIDIKQRNSLGKIFETENSLFVNDISREIKNKLRDFLEREFNSGNSSIDNIENFFKKMSEGDIYVKYNNKNVKCSNKNEKSIYEFINYIKGIDDGFFGNMCLKFNISDDSIFIKNFYEKYIRARSITDFLIYNFEPGPSAGEELIISTFARLFEKFNDKKDKYKKKENILMMLDEVDVSFHPRLQQHLIELLIKFLETIAPEYNIQLLITTHSPIILSDLPKSNVVFLKKEPGEHIAKILDTNSLNNTFGANIMQLYKDSFFLKDGFIGSFAKSKIEQLITEIRKIKNDKTESKHLSSNSEYVLSLIDEPVLKTILMQWSKK